MLTKSRRWVMAALVPIMITNGLVSPILLTATLVARDHVPEYPYPEYVGVAVLMADSILERIPLEIVVPTSIIACAAWLITQLSQILKTVVRRGANYDHPKDTAIHGMCAMLWAWPTYLLFDHYQVGYASSYVAAWIIAIGFVALLVGVLSETQERSEP